MATSTSINTTVEANALVHEVSEETSINKITIGDLEEKEKLVALLQPIQEEVLTKLGLTSLEEVPIGEVTSIFFQHPQLAPDLLQWKVNNRVDYPLICTEEFEFGYQKSKYGPEGLLYYIKFYELLLVDHDHKKGATLVEKFCEANPDFLFYQHETPRGYHFLCLSHPIPYSDENAKSLQGFLDCDFWYIIFSNRYGYKYRLTPKLRINGATGRPFSSGNENPSSLSYQEQEVDTFVSRFVRKIGSGQEHPRCQQLYRYYLQFLDPAYQMIKKPPPSPNFFSVYLERIIHQEFTDETTEQMTLGMRKPQQLLENAPDHYLAIDMKRRTYYLCFRDLMMIDLDLPICLLANRAVEGVQQQSNDNKKTNDGVEEPSSSFDLMAWCEKYFPKETSALQLYQSKNGYHVFLVDQPRNFSDSKNFQFMTERDCDHFYSFFSYLRGYCVRLNRKEDESVEKDIYEDLGFYGNPDLQNERLVKLCQKHYQLSKIYQRAPPVICL